MYLRFPINWAKIECNLCSSSDETMVEGKGSQK
ncbi:unnamed protein product [Spirodela intermedia]|uniref:Uncharacterized protein n=1 Tax=Spirodela intermedia TaxID=51605 RepID=A0A7I8KYP6_SPIIN|nr:unnamed protein product [Spirodela intermedia]